MVAAARCAVHAAPGVHRGKVVTASADKTARLWAVKDGQELAVLRGHDSVVRSASFSPDGRQVVTASEDKTTRLWAVEHGKKLAVLHGHDSVVRSASFSPDGQQVVTASRDRTARLWDVSGWRSFDDALAYAEALVQRKLSCEERREFNLLLPSACTQQD